ncbi:MAG: CRISPR-associated endonuclease Cas1 [Deltaproteobacteria bacterium]|nr:CRISPR-associated endonuclease Cas1 [Deltaproteobacteria bacterium]
MANANVSTSTALSQLDVPELVPARMLNEFAYCPRLSWLEWVQGDFADSADTVDGRRVHRRVDQEGGALPAAEDAVDLERPVSARSVYLSAPKLGLVAKIDLVEGQGVEVTPIDYKRGQAPDVPDGAWEPERVQICAQALILEENGYKCASGVLYFAESRRRVAIPISAELRARTLDLLATMRETFAGSVIPPPLEDSPKCPRCSLVGICLPDEVNLLRVRRPPKRVGVADAGEAVPSNAPEPRRLLAARDDALPLYVQANGARIGKSGDELVVTPREGPKQTARLGQTSHIALFGNVQMSTQAIQAAIGHGIPITYYSYGGWFYGVTTGMMHKNVELRRLQYRTADDREASLTLARRFVATKIRNTRTMLRRNASEVPQHALESLRGFAEDALVCTAAESLLGIEGSAARVYFEHFPRMLKVDKDRPMAFDFEGRNRRPPRDPVNALLSLAYSLLAKDLAITLQTVGFDPYLGFYHQPRYGRPALALDMMEEFRPLVADSVVIGAINTGVVRPDDFGGRGGAVFLSDAGRVRFLRAYERRMDELVTHPVFGYRISYRRVLEVQARLLGRFLAGETPEYPGFQTR